MHINNISQKAASFILHKRFHPGNFKNMEKVWLAEQRVADGQRKEVELQQRRAQEIKIKELRRQHETPADSVHASIQWVYAQEDVNRNRSAEPEPAVAKAANGKPAINLRYVLDEPTKYGQVSEADTLRKLREDPLMLIKKAEILRDRKVESEKSRKVKISCESATVKRPSWDQPRECAPDRFVLAPAVEEQRPVDHRPAVSAEDEDDEPLGPPSAMKSIIAARHAPVISEPADELPDEPAADLGTMLARGAEIEDERKLRVERLRLLEQDSEEPRRAMPTFIAKCRAESLRGYDREAALRERAHDGSFLEDRRYGEEDLSREQEVATKRRRRRREDSPSPR